MKIAFNRRQKTPVIGPYIFLERLIAFLKKSGVTIVRNAGRFHQLHFINISGSGRKAEAWKAKKVLRIDGIYHDISDTAQNKGIKDTYHNVDGIVFQCKFAHEMAYKHFGKPARAKHEVIIPNGVDSSFCPQGDAIDHGFPHTIIVSGKWEWPSKRLPGMIDCFLALEREDVGLVILGNVPKRIQHPRIKYYGFVAPHKLPAYYRGADLMLHLAYTDWCPNAVVEAISCGVPIITTHNGGVPEIIKGSGVIIQNESDYNREFVDFRKLPSLNTELVAEAINLVLEDRQSFIKPRPDLSIKHCGQQYLEFFRKVLHE